MANSVLHSRRNPHFFQPLLPGFHYNLSIPLKFFSEHIEGRNERNTAELRSDACENTWKVKMEGRRLTVGWEEFTIAHDFRIGDIIIFRHEGDLVFHVTSFGPSFSEIQYDVQENIGNLSAKQHLKTEPESFSSDQPCFVARVTDSNIREDTLFLPRKFSRPDGLKKSSNKISLINEEATIWSLILKFRESTRTFYMKSGWRSFCRENGLKPGDSVTFKLERTDTDTRTPLLRFSSAELKKVSSKGKRKETGESSQRVSSSSLSSSLSESRFVTLTVTPASFKHCRLYLPKSFIRDNGMENAEGKKVTLLDKHGVEWPVNLVMLKRNRRMHLGSGLKEFLKAIGVKAYKSFVLELVWEDTTSPPMLKFCSMVKT